MKTKQEQGKCPKCGSENLDYGISRPDGESMSYEVNCLDCGFYGYEWYELKFQEYTER